MNGRLLLVGAAGIALLSLVLWLAIGPRPAPDQPAASAPVGGTDQPSGTDAAAAEPIDAPATPVRDLQPTAAEAGTAVQVIVLEEGTRRPVAGAEVVACDPDLVGKRIGERQAQQQVVLDQPARAAIRRALATVCRTDGNGAVAVRMLGASLLIEVTAPGGLWGRNWVRQPPAGPVEILLSPDRALRVRVVSSAREPVPDVWVGLRRRAGDGPSPNVRSRADGIAVFEHVQAVLDEHDDWCVGFGFPLQRAPQVPVARASLPTEPVELILPATGGVQLALVDEHGQPVDGAAVELQIAAFASAEHGQPMPPAGPWSVPRCDASGTARVPRIGLGLFLQITATARDAASRHRPVVVDLVGPQRADEVVACSIEWRSADAADASYPLLTGRFVRGDGRPWPRAEVDAYASIFPTPLQPHRSDRIEVAADGRFRLLLQHDCPPGGKRILRLMCREPRDLAGIEGRLDAPPTLPPGITDLGDVVLDHGPLLASGTVVDANGAPLADAVVELRQQVHLQGGDLWPAVDCAGGHVQAADGSFALHAIWGRELPHSPLRLHARCEGFAARELDLAAGASALRVVLDRNGGLAGSVLLGPGQRPDDIALVLLRDGKGIAAPPLRDDGTFEQDGLAPGALRFMAYLRTGVESDRKASRLEIGDLTISAGETNRDPRIQGLSIRGTAVMLTIRVTDRAGAPIQRAAVVEVGGRDELTDQDGVARLRPARLPALVHVTAFGYRDVEFADVRTDRDVALEPGLRIRLRTDAKPQGRDPDYHLGFFLHHVDAQGRRGPMAYGRSFPYERMYFDASGEASLPVPAAGSYDVLPRVFVSRRDNVGSGGVVPGAPIARITVLEVADVQTFMVAIPQSAVDAAVRDYDR